MVRSFLGSKGFRLEDIIEKTGFYRNASILSAKEIINENDETRKRFEIMASEVFRKFKACANAPSVHDHRRFYDAINIVSKSLREDRDQADISQIIQELHEIIGENIVVGDAANSDNSQDGRLYDISSIDFERLRQEFTKSPRKNTQVQNLKEAIEKRLTVMLAQNPLRTDFQQHYEKLIADYNREQDRPTIERTFEALLKFVADLDDEQQRAVREGLDEVSLALFDLLKKDELAPDEIKRIKTVAVDLYAKVQAELTHLIDWQWKEATRDRVKQAIFDFLYSDETGLPTSYSEEDITAKSAMVFGHVLNQEQYGMVLAAA